MALGAIRTQVSTSVQQMLYPLNYLPNFVSSFQVQENFCQEQQHPRKHEDVVRTKKDPNIPSLAPLFFMGLQHCHCCYTLKETLPPPGALEVWGFELQLGISIDVGCYAKLIILVI